MTVKYWMGRFVKRLNRFAGLVDCDGEVLPVHVPSSGRMEELLIPGAVAVVEPFPKGGTQKTRGRLSKILFEERVWVSIDSHLPNRLVREAIKAGELPEFVDYQKLKPESTYGDSRMDFSLVLQEHKSLIEVKSVTLVEDGLALFPDAPTVRGARHVRELTDAAAQGYLAFLVFVIQRGDARAFSPHKKRDPDFAEAVEHASANGVTILAYDCCVTPEDVTIHGPIPVRL
ncbi:MAG: DNA/RNA nuclease SfsA [Firmicutes bacterium]|nr:DNA/RNA nuclease SfsA [Bacillota bacterium]